MDRKQKTEPRILRNIEAELDSFLSPSVPKRQAAKNQRSYPVWAPTPLIAFHLGLKKQPNAGFDTEKYVAESGLTGDELTNLSKRLYGKVGYLPPLEATSLYETLLTDERMEKVWTTIARHAKTDTDSIKFALHCNIVQAAWRANPRLTTKDSQRLFKELGDTASRLAELMRASIDLSNYSVLQFLDDRFVRGIKESLDTSHLNYDHQLLEYVVEQVHFAIPSFSFMLSDIQEQANKLAAKIPTVRHPHSPKAEGQYFARRLSEFFVQTYQSPLHEYVATTTCVVIGLDNVTAAAVRQLVKPSVTKKVTD
ncbi:MAG: hypothetical protein NTX56_08070 [Proteobacteria bacterium]|nr:hypothetical protein [Pseudomonadota bacterium]